MPRHTFLDSILNRPSQNYAPPADVNGNAGKSVRGQKWQAPSDLPNAPGSSAQTSMLGGSLFKRSSKANLSQYGGSEAGASTSTLGFKSRFGRKKNRQSVVGDSSVFSNGTAPAGYYPSINGGLNYAAAPPSVADSQATATKKKRWWEAGSLGIGRRSRAGSIAGESIFSEPEPAPGQVPWNSHGLAGVGSGAKPRRVTQSDYGTSPRAYGGSAPPPMPANAALNAARQGSPARQGRLQSDVAPLGVSKLNPTLQPKSSKSKLTNAASSQDLKREPSSTSIRSRATSPPPQSRVMSPTPQSRISSPPPQSRMMSPPPQISRMPGALASSPHVRRLSQDGNNKQSEGADWKDFMKSMSGTEISKAWEGVRDAPSMTETAAKGTGNANLERRKSHYERLKKELQEDAQFEQNLRDPGLKNQDLIARAASQVVGSPPPGQEGADYVTSWQPGTIVGAAPQSADTSASQSPQLTQNGYPQIDSRMHDAQQGDPASNASHREQREAVQQKEDPAASSDESEEEDESEESSSDEEEIRRQRMLEVVREEDEDGSSVGSPSSRRSSKVYIAPTPVVAAAPSSATREAPKYRAFESALNKARYSTSSPPVPVLIGSTSTSRNHSLKSTSVAESRQSDDAQQSILSEDAPVIPSVQVSEPKSEHTPSPMHKDRKDLEKLDTTGTSAMVNSSDHSSSSTDSEAFVDALSPGADEANKQILPPSNQDKPTPPTPTASIYEEKIPAKPLEDTEKTEELNESDDAKSVGSQQTGRATVTFDQKTKKVDGDDAKSMRSSRPGTLQRRLSDLSLGTSFGASNIMRIGAQSRSSSSRRVKMSDDDEDSNGSKSDDEADEELRARIKAEQERLRNMKVGEDFFGESLSGILEKFDSADWDANLAPTVGQLGLDIGTHPDTKRNSITAQDVLSINAQERINEVRRLRAEGDSPSKGVPDSSDARTVESGIAPSFAALWLLNQAGDNHSVRSKKDKKVNEVSSPATITKEIKAAPTHNRQLSSASTEDGTPVSAHGESKLRSLFSGVSLAGSSSTTNVNGQLEKKGSVLDRPRQRGPKPREMGGVSIARGKLLPDAKEKIEEVEDVRSTLDHIWTPPGAKAVVKKGKEPQASSSAKGSSSEISLSPPSSPPMKAEPAAKVTASKDKPAPAKSAIKGSKAEPKSLADTLFSFQKDKTKKAKNVKQTVKESNDVEKVKIAKQEPVESKVEEPVVRKSVDTASNASDISERANMQSPELQRPSNPAPESDESTDDEQSVQANGNAQIANEVHDAPNARSPPLGSELWSGESAASTGPATPGASDFLEKNIGIMQPRTEAYGEPTLATSPQDKKLPLPPVPSFDTHDANGIHPDNDLTPAAITHGEPAYDDNNKTPRNEKQQPSFGVDLIPPTPPAVESNHHIKSSMVRTPPTLAEETDDPINTMDASVGLQRSLSSRSKGSIGKKSSSKRNSANSTTFTEYQGRGLSLPPGLVATTVATSAQRRHPSISEKVQEDTPDSTVKGRKSKSKKAAGKAKANEAEAEPMPALSNVYMDHTNHAVPPRSASMQPSLSEGLASLALPATNHSDAGSSSRGSDSLPANSRSVSPSPSPAVSVSGRSGRSSAVSSSALSSSAASEASSSRGAAKHVPPPVPRKIRTVSASQNGHARTSLMSAISEWENSPIDQDRTSPALPSAPGSGYASPVSHMPVGASSSGYASPIYQAQSYATRSQSSVHSGPLPSVIRNAPIGAATDTFLHPNPGASRRLGVPVSESLDGTNNWGGSGYMGEESQVSLGMQSQHSTASLPAVPQSSYRARDPVKSSNAIDDRLYAKTTMNTISITSGAFRNSKSLRRKRSSVDVTATADHQSRRGSIDSTRQEGTLVEELQKTTMSLTSHTPPPRKLGSTQLLVQMIACSIDEMDRLLLREKVRSENAFGFIPGRSFCGRVMETGWEVKRMRMGDIVFGLQSSRKCGALAEFMTIEEDLTAKAPEDCLTMEQIAALPSVGVMAHQLMTNHCSQLKRGSRVLILNAHDGVGLLTMQECATLGLIIVAHCPNQVTDGVAICEANGAHEVIIGEPLWALNTLHESSFDLVVDTVGGRRVYDAARRILAYEGQFCTCFGDLQSIVGNPNLKSHLRSLRRSFFKKDTKHIGYEWVGTDTSEDCREALEAVRKAAEEGLVCPRLKSVLAFGEAPRAFENTLKGIEEEPGAVVVRIS
ncbi:uncharacterized protein FA14DRAFT_44833 [Meira miltonrushii]|uniref:Enoyl reductase (ER) domain-containing protein n=1 Tax=Meira miltonrushii TaxID=1280837 RepID=A0A316VI07_9BASI|nr:uncharacterized protein FA14DRAFT_44833 [Meira miltonrushii]PWN35631.1 hypothetical protein FA14DRAFT_44833 [Meira miltonrushii]